MIVTRVPGLAALTLAFAAATLVAQVRPAAAVDMGTSSRAMWRGLTRRNAFVAHGDFLVGLHGWGGAVSAGTSTVFEFTTANLAGNDLGLGRRFGEWDTWVQYEHYLNLLDGPVALAGGLVHYDFNESAAAAVGTAAFNTTEAYVDARWRILRLEPRATVWYDLDKVKGFYSEWSVAYWVAVLPIAVPSLYLKMLYAFSWGQAVNRDNPTQPAYFSQDGLTHIDFSAQTQINTGVREVYFTPSVHFQVNEDGATSRLDRSGLVHGSLWWFDVSVSWTPGS